MMQADSHPEELFDRLHSASLHREHYERLRRHCDECVSCDLELRFEVDGWVDTLPDEIERALGSAALGRFLGHAP
jgi:hypothetical protein